MADIELSYLYSDKTINLELVEIKEINGENITYATHSLGDVSLTGLTAFTTFNITGDGDSYTVSAEPNGYYIGSYYIKVTEHYADGTDSGEKEFEVTEETINKTIGRSDMGTSNTATSVDIEIYNYNGILLAKQTKEF